MINRLKDVLRGRREAEAPVATPVKAAAEVGPGVTQRLDQLSHQLDQLQREMRLLLGSISLPPNEVWKGRPYWTDGAPGENVFSHSTLCRQESFDQPYFPYWTRRIGAGLAYHRKVWEFVFICQALWERGAIRPGARGLGFGVGREPLSAFFAAQDCAIVATDMAPEAAVDLGWSHTDQHAQGLEALRNPAICSNEQFERNVGFRVVDMNAVPEDLTDFDFCWSACAFEHLGSIEHGLRFVERSVDCLKPGGFAVHTTEFNVSSNEHTLSEGSTVLFRQRDMEELAERLRARGHIVAPFDFNPGLEPLDRYIDVAPYRNEPHLKLALAGYVTTSIGIIVQRGASAE